MNAATASPFALVAACLLLTVITNEMNNKLQLNSYQRASDSQTRNGPSSQQDPLDSSPGPDAATLQRNFSRLGVSPNLREVQKLNGQYTK